MNHETFLQHIESDGQALIEAAAAAPAAEVQACPGWTNRDLAKHLGNVYSFAIAQLQAATPETRAPSETAAAPAEGDISAWFRERHQALLAALRATPPESPAWTWVPDKTAAFFFRRMAHETAVHRWDAQHAAGTLSPIDPELATDGVNEAIDVFMQHRPRRPMSEHPDSSLHLHRTDGDGEWLLVVKDETLTVTNEHAKGDVAARGSAQDLLLYLWGRGWDGLDCYGEDELVEAWGSVTP